MCWRRVRVCGAGWRNVGQNSSHKFLQSTLPKAASRLRGRRGRGVSVEGGLLMGGPLGGPGGPHRTPGAAPHIAEGLKHIS